MHSGYITIVSGLPRSGTSMMMQVIEAGGIPVLTDSLRMADEHNPKGYYEFEPVKKTKQDPSWIPMARGKAVKMVYRLLYDLPDTYCYKVIFMQRDLREVLLSQNRMLTGKSTTATEVSDEKMMEYFRSQLAGFHHWIGNRKHFSMLVVNYRDMISSPKEQAGRLNPFLGGYLDVEAMVAAVDPILYRRRVE